MPDQQEPRAARARPSNVPTTVSPSVACPAGLDRRAPRRSRNARRPAADLVDAGLGVAAAVDVDERRRGRRGRPAARRATIASSAVELVGADAGAGRVREVHRAGKSTARATTVRRATTARRPPVRAILPGPCASSRSGCSRDPTSTGSSRWSRSRSRSGGGGPGTASAARPPCAGPARPRRSRRATGRTTSRRSSPGSAGFAPTTARAGRASPSIARPTRATGSSRSRGPAPSARGRSRRPRSSSPSATSRRPGAARLTGSQERLRRRAGRRGSASARTTPPALDPRRGPADPDRLDQRHERQEHGHPARSPTSSLLRRPARRHDDVRRRPRRRAARRGRRLDRARRRRARSSAGRDVDVAVLETARGGIVLRGVGYESNDASVLTNVSSDHLDLQGIHTLPELAEVKATICRMTRPDGWAVLNADDPLVAAIARRVRAQRRVLLARRDGVAGRPAAPRGAAAGHTSSRAASWSSVDGAADDADRRPVADDPDRASAGSPATTSPTPSPPPARRAGARRDDRRRSPTGCATSGRRPSARPGRLNLFRARQPDRHRRLRPQRGGGRGRPRRRRGDRRRGRGPGRRRSRRSSARPAIARTTRCAGSAGSRPSGPSGSRSRRRRTTSAGGPASRSSASCWPGSTAGGRRARTTSRSTRPRRRRCAPS